MQGEGEVAGMPAFLDSLKYNKDGHVAVIVQVCALAARRQCGLGVCAGARSAGVPSDPALGIGHK